MPYLPKKGNDMKIVIAPDSFKGSLSALEVCESIEKAIHQVIKNVDTIKLPISDGGEGMVESLLKDDGGQRIFLDVYDPLNRNIKAEYGILNDGVAVIEMASASGLPLLKENERNPLKTNTYGTGQLIRHAILEKKCTEIILGIGGSATNDGGMGLAQALGITFFDHLGEELKACGENLLKVKTINTDHLIVDKSKVNFTIACDVDNVLCGENGAAMVYGPQKGATKEMIKELDAGLCHFGHLLEALSSKKVVNRKGIGAAGGIALPLVVFFDGHLKSGLEIVLDHLKFDQEIESANLVITGEGKTDAQSLMGKAISGIARRCKKKNIPLIVVSGALEQGYDRLLNEGVRAVFSTYTNGRDLDWHLKNADELLNQTITNLFRFYTINMINGEIK